MQFLFVWITPTEMTCVREAPIKTQPDLSENIDLLAMAEGFQTSLSILGSRLQQLRKSFEDLDAMLARWREENSKHLKVHNPIVEFDTPSDAVKDASLSPIEKKEALENLEQDAHQLLTASNEGMAPQSDHLRKYEPKLDEVVKAKTRIGEKPKHKPAQ